MIARGNRFDDHQPYTRNKKCIFDTEINFRFANTFYIVRVGDY